MKKGLIAIGLLMLVSMTCIQARLYSARSDAPDALSIDVYVASPEMLLSGQLLEQFKETLYLSRDVLELPDDELQGALLSELAEQVELDKEEIRNLNIVSRSPRAWALEFWEGGARGDKLRQALINRAPDDYALFLEYLRKDYFDSKGGLDPHYEQGLH